MREKRTYTSAQIGAFSTTIEASSGVVLVSPVEQVKKSKAVIIDAEKLGPIAAWGSNNLFPNEVISDIRKSDLIPAVRERKIEMLYGGGIRYGYYKNNGSNQEFIPLSFPEIDDFLENSAIDFYAYDALSDYFTFANFFPRLRKNNRGDKIARLECADAVHSRLGLQEKDGNIKRAYINANWDKGRQFDSPDTVKVDCLDPYFLTAQQMMQSKAGDFIAPMRAQRDGNIYYAVAPWNGIRKIGWLDVADFVPKFKAFLMKNIMKTKLIITVDPDYWTSVYPNWNNMKEKERQKAKQELIDMVIETAQSQEKAGGTLTLPKVWDREAKAYREMVSIAPLKLDFESGTYNEDSQEADAHIYRSWGLQGSLIGMTPGKNHTAGSGSDLRVGRNNFVLDNKIHMDRILKPMSWVSAGNNWNKKYTPDKKIAWVFDNYFTATLNTGSHVKTTPEEGNGDS